MDNFILKEYAFLCLSQSVSQFPCAYNRKRTCHFECPDTYIMKFMFYIKQDCCSISLCIGWKINITLNTGSSWSTRSISPIFLGQDTPSCLDLRPPWLWNAAGFNWNPPNNDFKDHMVLYFTEWFWAIMKVEDTSGEKPHSVPSHHIFKAIGKANQKDKEGHALKLGLQGENACLSTGAIEVCFVARSALSVFFPFQVFAGVQAPLLQMEKHKYSHCISTADHLTGGGQGLMDGGLEATHMLHCGAVCFHWLHILVEDGKNLIVQNLVLPYPVSHFLKWLKRKR